MNSRTFIVKIIKNRKNIPHKIKVKAKNKIRPVYHRTKKAVQKSRYTAKLLTSSEARQLHSLVRQARKTDEEHLWGKSVINWQKIVDIYGDRSPVEAFVKLNQAHRQLLDYESAKKILSEGVEAVTKLAQSKGEVSQATLQDWLLLSKEKAELSVVERLEDVESYKKSIHQYVDAKQKRAKSAPKIAIVSAVSGGYDAFRPPAVVDSRFDYIVYADTPIINPGMYDVRPLPYIDHDTTRSARFVKTNLHRLLPDYDYVMWIDANIMMLGDIYPIIKKFIESKKEVGAMLHPVRTSPYEEMDVCLKAGKDDVDAIRDQKNFYQSEGYSSDKLIESNILLYSLKSPNIASFLNTWWNQIDKYSRRDQFSINYSLDKNKVDWTTIMDRPNTARNHPDFALVDHGKGNGRFKRLLSQLDSVTVDPFAQNPSVERSAKRIKSVTAIVCVHNALDEVKKCLLSIKKFKAPNLNVIIVDDGSNEETRDYLKDFKTANSSWIKLIRHNTAKGYTLAASAGLRDSKADLSVLVNSDTIVTKGWSDKMARALEINPGTGIVGPMSSAASHQSVPNHKSSVDQTAVNVLPEGVSIDDMNRNCEKWSAGQAFPLVPLVHGFCFGVRREVIDTIGFLDHDSFPRGYGEENDYCFRAANAGFGLVVATDTYIFHAKSKSFVSNERKQLMQEGGRMFRDLHGQRRITRAVKSMENNPYLQKMRDHANDLYIKKAIKNDDTESAVFLPESVSTLRGLPYEHLQQTLIKLNDEMVDWSSLETKFSQKKQSVKVSIVVLVLNNLEMTVRCIESVIKYTSEDDYELLVVSNGSDIETLLGLRQLKVKYPQIKLINIEQNLNFALGNNIGFSFANGKYAVLLNNDTYVSEGWLNTLIAPIEANKADITQSLLVYPEGDIQSAGIVFNDKSDFGYALYAGLSSNDPAAKKDRTLQAATGACIALRSLDYAKLKGFDTRYINGQEDTDLCLRLKQQKTTNFKGVRVVAGSVVYHDESRTPGRGTYKFKNRLIFRDRWNKTIQPDDRLIYDSDGFEVTKWLLDTPDSVELGVPIYTPKLRKLKK